MKAYDIGASADSFYLSKWKSQYQLPNVECAECGETSWDANIWYPSWDLVQKEQEALFSGDRTVSVPEFRKLKAMIRCEPFSTKVTPGSRFGTVFAKLPSKGGDFRWCGFLPLVHRGALDRILKSGFQMQTRPVFESPGGRITDYFAVQPAVVPLYSPKTLKEITLVYCKNCYCWNMTNFRAKPISPREYVKERMPSRSPFVKVEEGAESIASEEFRNFALAENLTGIKFEESGVFM